MALYGVPPDALVRLVKVIFVQFIEELVQVILDHHVERKWPRLALFPSPDVDTEYDQDGRSQQDRGEVIYDCGCGHGWEGQQEYPEWRNDRCQINKLD